jgi:diaminopimelate epimerase
MTTAPDLAFEKYEGLGNDFIVVTAAREDDVPIERAVALCDRHFGVGADGVLVVLPPRTARSDVRMRVINADGSVPEMCGNGVRCVALAVTRSGLRHRGPDGVVLVDTDAGECVCRVEDTHDQGVVTVDLGVVRVGGERRIEVGSESVVLTTADAGNPHAVIFGSFSRADVDRLGSKIAVHPDFPHGTNVEFAQATAAGIDLVVWERGVGVTLACGTGACATAAVACAKGLASTGTPISVLLPGGRLEVRIGADGSATMRGPARRVFTGSTRI